MTLIVDAHCDLAWNMLNYGRDYSRAAIETRAAEAGTHVPEHNGDSLIGWPDYQRGQVAVIFSTLYVTPARHRTDADRVFYSTFDEAHRLYMDQLHAYHQLAESGAEQFRILLDAGDLKEHLDIWRNPAKETRPVGLVILMEGADGLRSVDELQEWHAMGLRLIGLSWAGTRYAGGTKEPGPLTDEGRRLLKAMADFNFTLDLSHMDELAALQALDLYEGPIVATHGTCNALVPGFETNRLFTDRVIQGVIEHNGVVGLTPLNSFLKADWKRLKGSRREEVPLDVVAAHIDHVCQLAGDAAHAGIGSDFDGGFGVQSVPPEIDTIADLQKLAPLLAARGYSEEQIVGILGGNWLNFLQANLPA